MPTNSRLWNFVGLVTYHGNKPYRVIGTVYGIDEDEAETNVRNAFLEQPDEFKIVRINPRPENRIISLIATADE